MSKIQWRNYDGKSSLLTSVEEGELQDCSSESSDLMSPLSTTRSLLVEHFGAAATTASAAATSVVVPDPWPPRTVAAAVRVGLEDPSSSITATTAHYAVVCLILASTLSSVLVTVREIEEAHFEFFHCLEGFFTLSFTLEILVRVWTATSCISYICSPSNMIDILATLPWYVEFACNHLGHEPGKRHRHFKEVADSFRTLRMARLFRMVRLAKVARHSETVPLVLESIIASRGSLFMLVACVGLGSVVSATLIYAVESDNPSGDFKSVPAAMWWALTTITTVGYGDMVPESVIGKFIGSMTMVGGTLIVSLSVATITSSFTENYTHKSDMAKYKKAMLQRQQKAKKEETANSPTRVERTDSRLLIHRIAHLEDELKSLLLLLEGELDDSTSNERETPVIALFSHTKQFPVVDASPTPASLLLESLRSQSATLFKSIRGLAEHTAVAAYAGAAAVSGHGSASPVPASVRSLSFGPPVVPSQAAHEMSTAAVNAACSVVALDGP
eukprot:CAMPEP_0115521666 /NCGR_PEP_ID=MMETSP0271-20121206/79669_1 /TAXON_ID=71861 /ORGANISM="Scrippsiella trochoidea, Strain CCMP3099" /LENGTH=501 /DNA_ID=CAMNT_0002952915 /DNA_START=48 /DNA_END=1554 /DNA_ORIENTATION=-